MWTVIRVSTATGQFYDAIEGAVDEARAVEFEDGEIIAPEDYEIVLEGLSESEMDMFMDLPASEQARHIENRQNP